MTSYLQHYGDSTDLIHIAYDDGESVASTIEGSDENCDKDTLHRDRHNKAVIIVGYVLANINRAPSSSSSSTWKKASTKDSSKKEKKSTSVEESCNAHITSIAVLAAYRRRGIAYNLIEQVHRRMLQYPSLLSRCPPVLYSMLHVRCSNHSAVNCYQKLNYVITQTIPCYYQDGESAYLMQHNFVKIEGSSNS